MTLLTIQHKRSECIGCGLCVESAPDYWFMNADGEAQLHLIVREQPPFDYGEGIPRDEARLRRAEAGCPVHVIEVG